MRKTACITFIALLSILASCKKENTPKIRESSIAALSSQKEIVQLKFESKNNAQQLLKDVECHIYDDKIVGCIPYLSNNKSLIATFTINGASITVNGVQQATGVTMNNYDRPLIFKVNAADGTTKDYTVTLYTFTGLPIFYLETEAPVVSKDDYVKGK